MCGSPFLPRRCRPRRAVLAASLALTLAGSGDHAAHAATPPLPACAVVMRLPEANRVSFRAQLSLGGPCKSGAAFRVRKTSTTSLKRNGAPYQPIKPNGSAAYGGLYSWTVTAKGSNIPANEEWTLYSWEWQWYDKTRWNTQTRQAGVWLPIRILGSAS